MELTNKQFEEVLKLSEVNRSVYKRWRKGQSFFNSLYDLHPEIADTIRGSTLDMFHIDENIDKFKEEFV